MGLLTSAVFNSRSKAIVLLADICILLLVITAVFAFRLAVGWSEAWPEVFLSKGIWLIVMTNSVLLYIFGAYDLERVDSFATIFWRIILTEVLTTVLVVLVVFFAAKDRSGIFGRGILATSLGLVAGSELIYRYIIFATLQKTQEGLQWLLISSQSLLEPFLNDLGKNHFHGKVTVLTDRPSEGLVEGFNKKLSDSVDIQGTWAKLEAYLEKKWAYVVLAIEDEKDMKVLGSTLMQARFSGKRFEDLTQFYEQQWKKVPLFYLNHSWFVLSDGFNLIQNPIGLRLKRLIDLFLSAVLLLITWPIMLIAAVAIKLDSPGAVLFSQIRTGRDGANFKIYKFRSMRTDAEKAGAQWAQKNDARITRAGKWIRLTRVDELPQLLNVFKGDMSFIGPRPERPEFNALLEKEIPFYQLRHMVNPGITGWAQVLYPYGASVEDSKEKLQYELYYIKNYSLLMDLQIVLKTIRVVVLGRGR